MSRLNDLIRQLRAKDPALADDIEREVGALADRRSFGLNFERHTPEAVELPGRRVRRGDKVRILPPRGTAPTKADERLWLVERIEKAEGMRTATLLSRDGSETVTAAVDDLVVVAEFRDPIYPGLVSTGRIERGGNQPFHTVINAENYHALQTLLFTHRGTVDCIYIDPPYNTGTADWIYNDRYVAGDDLYRHSKWLAFMERRLILARELLKDTGVIIVAIGDDEHHRLRMLMDQIFGPDSFLANVVWIGSVKNDARFSGAGLDYMLVYSRNYSSLVDSGAIWREPKEGLEDVLAAGAKAWEDSSYDSVKASRGLSGWWNRNKSKYDPGLGDNVKVDDNGTVIKVSDLRSPNPRENLQYDVLHPVTGQPVRRHPNGWVYKREVMEELIESGRVVFGADHTAGMRKSTPLSEMAQQSVRPRFYKDRRAASRQLELLLGDKRFPYPKDHEVLMRWIGIVTPKDGVVLDFFGGSGSTSEAVFRLNAREGSRRTSILVTNNEVSASEVARLRLNNFRDGDPEWEAKGVHEYVTRPRIRSVVMGERPDGSTFDDPVPANVEFFTLTYEAPLRVASHREFEKIAPLLWMRAGSRGRRIDDISLGWDVADSYGVIADFDHTDMFVKELAARSEATHAFVVTDDNWLFESLCRELPDHVEPVRLYEAYLRNFELEAGRDAR